MSVYKIFWVQVQVLVIQPPLRQVHYSVARVQVLEFSGSHMIIWLRDPESLDVNEPWKVRYKIGYISAKIRNYLKYNLLFYFKQLTYNNKALILIQGTLFLFDLRKYLTFSHYPPACHNILDKRRNGYSTHTSRMLAWL